MLLQTDRLTVRPVEASDWEAMQAIWLDFSKYPCLSGIQPYIVY